MRTLSRAALGLALLGLAACGGGVTVRWTGVAAPPRPANCDLEVFRKAPERPYDALAGLDAHVTLVPGEGALSVVKGKACELGADAIVVDQEMILNELGHTLVSTTAIKYRPAPPAPVEEPAPAKTVDPAR